MRDRSDAPGDAGAGRGRGPSRYAQAYQLPAMLKRRVPKKSGSERAAGGGRDGKRGRPQSGGGGTETLQVLDQGLEFREALDCRGCAADLLLGSPQATPDVEALLGDCEFVGHAGNVAFFTGKGPHWRDYRRGATLKLDKGIGAKYVELQITDKVQKQQPEFQISEWE